jgi:transcriptional regulator with XRE-family HTH domain
MSGMKRNVVGNNIRSIRTRKGMTQEALALESGLSQAYINQLENGKRLYTQKSLELIAQALATPMAQFFVDEIAQGPLEANPIDGKPYRSKEQEALFLRVSDILKEGNQMKLRKLRIFLDEFL